MTVVPITPKDIDISSLILINEFNHVRLSSSREGDLGSGLLKIMVQSDQKLLVLVFNQRKIILASNSKAWLEQETIMIPHVESGLWKIDCSNPDQLVELQDILTFFIKYENRHCIKNTLALIDPKSCQVTQVVADNVTIDLEQEDFIESREKVPVYVDSKEKVKFLYQSGEAMITGSDWIANALVFTGQALAKGITSGSQLMEEKIQSTTPFQLSDQDKNVLDMVYNTTHTVTSAAASALDKVITAATSHIRPEPKSAKGHFGWSALKATATVIGGAAAAAGLVLDSSRDGISRVIRKKYGADAGYVVEKTIGTASHVAGLLVYFDAKGISRTVILGGLAKAHQREVVFENKEDEEEKKKA